LVCTKILHKWRRHVGGYHMDNQKPVNMSLPCPFSNNSNVATFIYSQILNINPKYISMNFDLYTVLEMLNITIAPYRQLIHTIPPFKIIEYIQVTLHIHDNPSPRSIVTTRPFSKPYSHTLIVHHMHWLKDNICLFYLYC
jgi:hypothetical protein